jgi:lysozyme family protein
MAIFDIAFARTMGIEGSYDNNPDDKGGETCWGIARNYHKKWQGWGRVDALKRTCMNDDGTVDEEALSKLLANDPLILKAAKEFYKKDFWDKVKGDSVEHQFVANELFDTAVNMSPKWAIKFLQKSLNKLNRDEDYYPDMVVDGMIGPTTLGALKVFLARDSVGYLLKSQNGFQFEYYAAKSSEDFFRGYLNKRLEVEI